MNVRELPRAVEKNPVVKAIFLGWLSTYAQGGYFCAAITYDKGQDRFHLYLLRALGLDKPWLRTESERNLSNGEAVSKFKQYEELAEWSQPLGDH